MFNADTIKILEKHGIRCCNELRLKHGLPIYEFGAWLYPDDYYAIKEYYERRI